MTAVILAADGTAKLADFGLATILHEDDSKAKSHVGVSHYSTCLLEVGAAADMQTAGYMAPVKFP